MIRTTATLDSDVERMLAKAIERGGHTAEGIRRKLAEGRALVWIAGGGCVLTEVDQDNVCTVLLGGGQRAREWVGEIEAAIIASPAHREVETYRIVGRKGWKRLFPHWTYAGEHDGCAVLERAA